MIRRNRKATTEPGEAKLPEAGELLPVEALDRTGLMITSEGALVRVLHVIPPNPLILAPQDRQRIASSFCHIVARLRPGQSLQFYVQARPVNLDEVLLASRREVGAWAGDAPTNGRTARDPLALSRWRLYAAMEESLRQHADDQAAVETNAYVVVPYVPDKRSARALLNELRLGRGKDLPVAPLDRPTARGRPSSWWGAAPPIPDANAEIVKVARLFYEGRGLAGVEPAYVSLASPSVPEALERCRRLGARSRRPPLLPVRRRAARPDRRAGGRRLPGRARAGDR